MQLFSSDEIAAGYAAARPMVHPVIVERAFQHLGAEPRRDRILDVGCGAGASTRAVGPWAHTIVGLDPEIRMIRNARAMGGAHQYTVGAAEAMPIGTHTVDGLTAAGALNFVDLGRFRVEAARVLTADGVIVVYDFATGRRCADTPELERRYDEFAQRWPRPIDGRHAIDADVLAAAGFAVGFSEQVMVPIAMNADAYVDYLMTETNVTAAIRGGERATDVRHWCHDRFSPVFSEPRVIEFDAGYVIAKPTA